MSEVVRQMMMEFYQRNSGKKPEAIIYYRDGVADSQFPTVLEYEYKAFRQVCRPASNTSSLSVLAGGSCAEQRYHWSCAASVSMLVDLDRHMVLALLT